MTNIELKQNLEDLLSKDMRYAVGRFEDRIEDDDLLNEPKTSKSVETFLSKREAISLVLQYTSNESVQRVNKEHSSVVVLLSDLLSQDRVHTFNRRIVIAECW